jgi:hypothetical protein
MDITHKFPGCTLSNDDLIKNIIDIIGNKKYCENCDVTYMEYYERMERKRIIERERIERERIERERIERERIEEHRVFNKKKLLLSQISKKGVEIYDENMSIEKLM